MRGIAKILLVVLMVLSFGSAKSQVKKRETGGKPDPQLSQKDNDFIDRQAKVFLDSASVLLKQFPPATFPESRERGFAKMLLDAVLHDHYAAQRKPVQQYFRAQVDKVIQELETTKVEKGVRIWKIYDMGFIARTRSVTLAFDIVTGITSRSADFAMSSSQLEKLAKQCDALLITHYHSDHAEKAVANQFLDLGLPVLAPEQWKADTISEKIIFPERVAGKIQPLRLKNKKLDMIVYPGHQMRSTDNNVYLVKTPEGIWLAHNGDQINEGDFMIDWEWIDKVKDNQKVDVLMTNAWTTDIMRIVKGFNPKLVMSGHETELGHTVWDRLPYWGDEEYLGLNYSEVKKSDYSLVVTTWGESYHYIPKD